MTETKRTILIVLIVFACLTFVSQLYGQIPLTEPRTLYNDFEIGRCQYQPLTQSANWAKQQAYNDAVFRIQMRTLPSKAKFEQNNVRAWVAYYAGTMDGSDQYWTHPGGFPTTIMNCRLDYAFVISPGKGDANKDDKVDNVDVSPFLQSLTDPEQYLVNYGSFEECDCNNDGKVDFADVNMFLFILEKSGQ